MPKAGRSSLRVLAAAVVGATLLCLPRPASAACVCRCINGIAQPLCTSPTDLLMLCPLMVCPAVPPAIVPVDPPLLPPVGTSYCEPQRVLNPDVSRYEWRQVCR